MKEIAPENVASSRRLMVKSVFSVGKRLDSGGSRSVKKRTLSQRLRESLQASWVVDQGIRYKKNWRRNRKEVWRRERGAVHPEKHHPLQKQQPVVGDLQTSAATTPLFLSAPRHSKDCGTPPWARKRRMRYGKQKMVPRRGLLPPPRGVLAEAPDGRCRKLLICLETLRMIRTETRREMPHHRQNQRDRTRLESAAGRIPRGHPEATGC